MNTNRAGAAVILVIGLFVLYLGVWLWRRSRRRSRQSRAGHVPAPDENTTEPALTSNARVLPRAHSPGVG
jgi:cbb3-type cytochrome oxidase subunit 3